MLVGLLVRRLRRDVGITQEQLARRAGIGQSYLSQIENKKKEPSLATIQALAKAFEIPNSTMLLLALDPEEIEGAKRNLLSELQDGLYRMCVLPEN